MKTFIRLKSNPRYAVNEEGLLKDMIGIVALNPARKVLKRRAKDGMHALEANGVESIVSADVLVSEIRELSAQRGISLDYNRATVR